MTELEGDSPDIVVGDLLTDSYGRLLLCTGIGDRPIVTVLAPAGEAWLPLQRLGQTVAIAADPEPAAAAAKTAKTAKTAE